MKRDQTVTQKGGPVIELYACETESCGRKAALMYEPGREMTAEELSWVEQEVSRHGAFFPSDYGGGGGGMRTRD